jgi:MFS family permease
MSSSRASLLVIFLTVFIDLLGFGMVLPLLPIYAKQFSATGMTIGLLMSSFSAMQFLFAPLWGRLSDRIGRRPVLIVGLAGSVVFYALFGYATVLKSLTLMFVARIGAGIAGATISTAQAYIADCTTKENRAKGMALVGAAFGIGFTFGPLFGYLAVPTGTGDPGPGPGYAAAALSAVALLLAIFKLPESLTAENASTTQHERRGWFNLTLLRDALSIPSIGLLLLANFLCVFSFANFESTLSLIIKDENGAFRFSFREVCLTFAYIGLMLTLVQGGLVRRLSGRVPEGKLAVAGSIGEIIGLLLLWQASRSYSLTVLLIALAVTVGGFAFLTPSINSLLSRRSDPAKQGGVLGVGQSVSALARILGPAIGIPLSQQSASYPLLLAVGVMVLGTVLLAAAAKSGRDFET